MLGGSKIRQMFMKEIRIVCVLCLMTATVVFVSGCFEDENEIKYNYEAKITPLGNGTLNVIIPVPTYYEESKTSQEIIDNLESSSATSFEITNEDKGQGLSIVTSKSCTLNSQGRIKYQDEFPGYLSMNEKREKSEQDGSERDYWLYSSINSSLELKFYITKTIGSKFDKEFTIATNLTTGWQLVTAQVSIVGE